MTEEEYLNQEADDLFSKFLDTDLYKRYSLLKQSLLNDESLMKLLQDRKKLQSTAKYLPADERKDCLALCRKLQEEYDSSPLVINYRQVRDDLLQMIAPLTEADL